MHKLEVNSKLRTYLFGTVAMTFDKHPVNKTSVEWSGYRRSLRGVFNEQETNETNRTLRSMRRTWQSGLNMLLPQDYVCSGSHRTEQSHRRPTDSHLWQGPTRGEGGHPNTPSQRYEATKVQNSVRKSLTQSPFIVTRTIRWNECCTRRDKLQQDRTVSVLACSSCIRVVCAVRSLCQFVFNWQIKKRACGTKKAIGATHWKYTPLLFFLWFPKKKRSDKIFTLKGSTLHTGFKLSFKDLVSARIRGHGDFGYLGTHKRTQISCSHGLGHSFTIRTKHSAELFN